MAIEIKGLWSSIRPVNEGEPPPLDLSREGWIDIRTYEPLTGAITGYYVNIRAQTTEPLEGFFRFVGSGSYTLTMQHRAGSYMRLYEGCVAATQEGDFPVFIIAGQWRNLPDSDVVRAGSSTASAADGQEDGTWVATKP